MSHSLSKNSGSEFSDKIVLDVSNLENPKDFPVAYEQSITDAAGKFLDFDSFESLWRLDSSLLSSNVKASPLESEFLDAGDRSLTSNVVKDDEESMRTAIFSQVNIDQVDPLTGLHVIPDEVITSAAHNNSLAEDESLVLEQAKFDSSALALVLEESELQTPRSNLDGRVLGDEKNLAVSPMNRELPDPLLQMCNQEQLDILLQVPPQFPQQFEEDNYLTENLTSFPLDLGNGFDMNLDLFSSESCMKDYAENVVKSFSPEENFHSCSEPVDSEICDIDDGLLDQIMQLNSNTDIQAIEKEAVGERDTEREDQTIELMRDVESDIQCVRSSKNDYEELAIMADSFGSSAAKFKTVMHSKVSSEKNALLTVHENNTSSNIEANIETSLVLRNGDDVHPHGHELFQIVNDDNPANLPNFKIIQREEPASSEILSYDAPGHGESNRTGREVCKVLIETIKKKSNAEQAQLYKCKDCPETFELKEDFKRHRRRRHPNPKTLKCDMCPMKFSLACNMAKHKRTVHLNERNFMCPVSGCNKKFAEKNKMKKHVASVHEAQKNFKCEWEGCNQRFGQKSDLTRHVSIIHNGVKRFECMNCAKIEGAKSHFGRRSSLAQHLARVHSMNTTEVNDCFESGEYHTQDYFKFTKVMPTKPSKKLISKTRLQKGRKFVRPGQNLE